MNSRKEIKIRAFGCAMENSSKNNFQCLVTFWKCYLPTIFSHFLSFQTNFIAENPPLPIHWHPQKIHHYLHKTHHHTTQKPPKHHHPHYHNNNKKIRDQREKDWEIEGKRDRSRKRDRSKAVATRTVLGGSRMRSVLGGDDENKMQGDRRCGSWVFVDRWWGRVGWDEESVMGVCAEAWLGGDEGSVMKDRWSVIDAGAWLGDDECAFSLSLSLFISKSYN